jgi:hypothetical protein
MGVGKCPFLSFCFQKWNIFAGFGPFCLQIRELRLELFDTFNGADAPEVRQEFV